MPGPYWLHHFTFPDAMHKGFHFCHIPTSLVICLFSFVLCFDSCHPNGYEFFFFLFLSDPFSCHHLGSHLHLLLSLWSRLLVCLFLANWHMLFLLLYASPTTSFTGEVSGSSFLWAVFVIPLSMYHWTLQSVIVIPALREYLLEVKPLLTLHAC